VVVQLQVSSPYAILATFGKALVSDKVLEGVALNEKRTDPKFLTVDDMRPLGTKVLVPAMFILVGILAATSSTTRPPGVVLSGIIILLGIVQFVAVGLVKPTQECLFYRRFLKWRRIEYSDIAKCGRPIFPLFWGLHYIRLHNFEPPLGRLYFVQYHPARPLSQHELDQEMIEQIRSRIAGKNTSLRGSSGTENSSLPTSSQQLGVKACAISAILSMLLVVFLRVLLSWPGPNFPPKILPGQHVMYSIIIYFSLFCIRLLYWPYNLVAIVVLLAGIGILRFKGHAASLSAALGAILGGIVTRWFN
jgi:hypothetical protein